MHAVSLYSVSLPFLSYWLLIKPIRIWFDMIWRHVAEVFCVPYTYRLCTSTNVPSYFVSDALYQSELKVPVCTRWFRKAVYCMYQCCVYNSRARVTTQVGYICYQFVRVHYRSIQVFNDNFRINSFLPSSTVSSPVSIQTQRKRFRLNGNLSSVGVGKTFEVVSLFLGMFLSAQHNSTSNSAVADRPHEAAHTPLC